MAAPERRSSGLDRRTSTRNSARYSTQDDNEEDLYGADAMGVSDGFRPSHGSQNHNRIASRSSQLSSGARRPSPSSPPPRPSSATKPRNIDSFALRYDGSMGTSSTETAAESSSSSTRSRTTSMTSSDAPIMVADGPYQGPTRPSHPYQMYPQDSRPTRTASIATTSTFAVPAERAYNGPSGPTHPYGMYPQNTVPEAEEVHGALPNANIPVGFPGLAGSQYQRRFGPDGEEAADLIGPDGHTEQLPPYTKYPDESFVRKPRPAVLPDITGAGGIGLATRNPEFASQEDLSAPPSAVPSRHSTGSAMSGASAAPVAGATTDISEKHREKHPEKKWKTMAKQRVCGVIPVWALCLAVTVIVVLALLLGILLGILMARKAHPKLGNGRNYGATTLPSGVYISTVTTTIDATPLATLPTGFPELPVGNFSLAMGEPSQSDALCLENTAQLPSWSCNIPTPSLQLSISSLGEHQPNISNKQIHISQSSQANKLRTYTYGTQPPALDEGKVLSLVTDFDDPEYGPAWFFQVPFRKLVVLHEDALAMPTAGSSRLRRRGAGGAAEWQRKGVAQPGDKPWFCYWDGTLLEAFVFANTTSRAAAAAAAAVAVVSSTLTSPTPSPTTTPFYGAYVGGPYGPGSFEHPTTPTPTPTSTTASSSAPQATPSVLSMWPAYPKVIKFEERRMPRKAGFGQPYCVQMAIGADGMSATPVTNATGGFNTIMLSERISASKKSRRGVVLDETGIVEERDVEDDELVRRDLSNECHCAWLIK